MNHNINDRGDISTLKEHFNGDYFQFILAWAQREPALVREFYKGGFEHSKRISVTYKFLPIYLVRYMSPFRVQQWDKVLVKKLATQLEKAMNSGILEDYKQTKRIAAKIRGIGPYSKEHLYRSALLMTGKRHPSTEFVKMGSGACYDLLRQVNIKNIHELNTELQLIYPGSEEIDAGNIAYIMCSMLKKR